MYRVLSAGFGDFGSGGLVQRSGWLVERVLWGGLDDLIQTESEKGYMMIEVSPERCIYRPSLDITLNKWNMRSKCKHTTLYAKMFAIIGLQRLNIKVLNII